MVQDDCLAPETMWKRIGFIRYAPEYWLLGSLLTDRISGVPNRDGHGSPPQSDDRDTTPTSQQSNKPHIVEPILDKYDQTSMRQVNDLITGFQKIQID